MAHAGDSAETLIARADAAMYAVKSPHLRNLPVAPEVSEKLAAADVEKTMQEAMDALVHVERMLSGTWNGVAGAPSVDRDMKDRLVQATRLVAAAARALDPHSLQ